MAILEGVILLSVLLISLYWLNSSRKKNNPRYLRKTSLLETWYCSSRAGHIFSLTVSVKSMSLTNEVVKGILIEMYHRYPRLACGFEYSGSSCYIMPLLNFDESSLPLFFLEKTNNQPSLEFVLDQEYARHFDEKNPSAPLWRLLVRRDSESPSEMDLILVFHHFLADGMSAVGFFTTFFEVFHNRSGTRRPLNQLVIKRENVGPSIDECLNTFPTLPLILQEIPEFLFGKNPRTYYQGPESVFDINKLQSKTFYFLPLSPLEFENLTLACKREKTTIHGALCAAANFAVALVANKLSLEVLIDNPISLRKTASIHPQELGVFICGIDITTHMKPDIHFWNIARNTRSMIENALPKAYQYIGLLRFVGDMREFSKEFVKGIWNERTATMELSNLGKV